MFFLKKKWKIYFNKEFIKERFKVLFNIICKNLDYVMKG